MTSVSALDALRVKADALLADGDPQGEAIQLALALEEMSPADARRAIAEARYDEIVARHGPRWLQPLRIALGENATPDAEPALFRGLPAMLRGAGSTILQALPKLSTPILALELTSASPADLWQLSETDAFANLATLALALYDPVDVPIVELFASPRFPSLESLELSNVTRDGAQRVMAAASQLRALQRLEIRAAQHEPATFGDLAPLLTESIRHLDLDGVTITGEDLDTIGERCPRLRSLFLSHAKIDARVAARLDQRAFAGVERFGLDGNPLKEAGVAAVASARHLEGVVFASFARRHATDPPFGAKLLQAFVDALTWKRLRGLQLGYCNIRADGVALLGTKRLAKLTHLGLHGNMLNEAGARVLAQLPLSQLHTLDLERNTLEAPAMVAIAKAPWLAHVEVLALRYNKLGSAGARALANASLEKLRVLAIGYSGLAPGLRAILHRAPKLVTIVTSERNHGAPELAKAFLAAKQPLALAEVHATGLAPQDLDALIASPRLATLGALTICGSAFDDARATTLVANPHAAAIGRLVLGGAQLTEAGRGALIGRYGAHVVFVDEAR